MKTKFNKSANQTNWIARLFTVATFLAVFLPDRSALADDDRRERECRACKSTAQLALQSARAQATSDYLLAQAKASTLPTEEERKAARDQARDEFKENNESAKEQYAARLELCELLGECRYNPVINPANFLTPSQIAPNPNPYFPLIRGTTRRYQKTTDEGTEVVEVVVTHQTKVILGVTCIEVRDTVRLNGVLVEDTLDWFTQDLDGNVWYFGERSIEYEGGVIASLEGSWEAGVNGAKPGLIMKANPQVGDAYRQEFALGDAEDAAKVVALNESATVPFGSFNNCLKTAEFTPLDPESLNAPEHKFYAVGVGLVLEVGALGARLELIEVVTQ